MEIDQKTQIEKAIDELTLFDDDLMSKVFDENIEATKLLLNIILERNDIEIVWVKGQEELKSPIVGGRTVKLDIRAILGDARQIDIEVQRNKTGAHVRRARFHSSMLDSRMLREKQKFEELKDSYVIFICENDKFGKGLPIYHIDRYIRETRELVDDGSYIIYVNGAYEGDDDLGLLIHDFKCKKSSDIHYKELADGVKHFKETREGRDIMCDAFEKLADERAEIIRLDAIKNNLQNLMDSSKIDLEEAMNILKIADKDREMLCEIMK